MRALFLYLYFRLFVFIPSAAAQPEHRPAAQRETILDSFRLYSDVKITVDRPAAIAKNKPLIVTFFALPNGNSTAWTMGKKREAGEDWHYDIQHIRAQTAFIREQLPRRNFIVIYLENDYKSWPAWKQKHPDFKSLLPRLVDSLAGLYPGKRKSIYFNGHSGGGSFIFGYLAGVEKIPSRVKRISFLDSNYGYDSSYYPKLEDWLGRVKGSNLNVFAYNDSVALYNGKPLVSATGGTWYRSHLMLRHLASAYSFSETVTDSFQIFKSGDGRIQFFFKPNYNRGIYHTQQVELNGFIHSVLCGTKAEGRGYQYYGKRAYEMFIQ